MIGFISPLSDCFCDSCNRLRLTAIGRIRPCLFSDTEIDIKTPLRNGISDDELNDLYCRAVLSKPARHSLHDAGRCLPGSLSMSQIGG